MTLEVLEPPLQKFLLANFPEIPDLLKVELLFSDRLPFDFWDHTKDGITWGPRTINLRTHWHVDPNPERRTIRTSQPIEVELLCHELTHVRQAAIGGFRGKWSWGWHYLWNAGSMEAEAYQNAARLRALFYAQGS